MEVLRNRERLQARVAVVSFAKPASLRAYKQRFGLDDVVLLSDQERVAYAAFGFNRASAVRVWLDPRVWWRYAGLLARGRRPERPEDDPLQLGGDVLVDEYGAVQWVYRSTGRGSAEHRAAFRGSAAKEPRLTAYPLSARTRGTLPARRAVRATEAPARRKARPLADGERS